VNLAEHEMSAVAPVAVAPPRTCRRCKQQFTENGPKSCRFHPESYSGETAQRWKAPGDVDGGGAVHYFWTCCGSADRDSSGCCAARHISYDDEDEAKFGLRPGDQAAGATDDGRPESP
jgi:hypothetical protein